MDDYRLVQLEKLEKQIAETKELVKDPAFLDVAEEELHILEEQKRQILLTMEP